MIDGVDVLNTVTIYNTYIPLWVGFICVLIAFGIFGITMKYLSDHYIISLIILSILLIIVITTVSLAVIPNKSSIKHIEYDVLINDNMPFTEIDERYEIIRQKGKIYTIKERTN